MKITDYSAVTKLTNDNVFLVDGTNGTKKILTTDAILSVLGLLSVENRRKIFRGKNLGTSLTVEQKAAIQNGSFDDMWLGDYWIINGVTWRIADFDYWYGYSEQPITNHHLVIMPDTALNSVAMNDTSTTAGGYLGSKMYTEYINTAKTAILDAFSGAVLTHKEYLIDTVESGNPTSGTYVDSIVDLPNEMMIFGSYIYTPANNGSNNVRRFTISNRQLALFASTYKFLAISTGFWLRDIGSSTQFVRVTNYGAITLTGASSSYGVRPVFAIG